MDNGTILSPAMLWNNFSIKYPLQESKTSEEVFDNVIYSDVYFSGRDTEQGRVRIFGVYAKSRSVKRSAKTASILIIPDACDTVDIEIVNYYVKQGYAVLMIDYRGENASATNFTRYPECISYANYDRRGRNMDRCDGSARSTCWYEWVAVAKYALNFLKSQKDMESIGVLGIKAGADIGWQLCATEDGVSCFVPLFCAGWRAYRGFYKNGEEDLPMNDERLRFLAGVDSSAYAQYMRCPTLYLTATNSTEADFDRCSDTLLRIPEGVPAYANFTPRSIDVLDPESKKDSDLFFAKYLLNYKIDFPEEAKITLNVNGDKVTAVVEEGKGLSDRVKKVAVYIAEGNECPFFRDWREMKPISAEENKQEFGFTIRTSCSFVTAFAVISYRNGLTLSTNLAVKKFPERSFIKKNLVYSGKKGLAGVAAYLLSEKASGKVFYLNESPLTVATGAGGISGVTTDFGMAFYNFNSSVYRITEFSMIKMDVFAERYCVLKIGLVTEKTGDVEVYEFSVTIRPSSIWNNVLVKLGDFKNAFRRSITDFDTIRALVIESDVKYVLNNVLVI